MNTRANPEAGRKGTVVAPSVSKAGGAAMIDNSPSGSFKKALAAQDKRNAANASLAARNDRIKRHIALGCDPAVIAAKESVSLEYVRRIGGCGG